MADTTALAEPAGATPVGTDGFAGVQSSDDSDVYWTFSQVLAYIVANLAAVPVFIQVAISDRVTALATGTDVASFRAPHAFTLTGVRASVDTASTSGLVTLDIKKNGTSVLSTLLTIDATEKTSTTAATAAVIATSSIADDDEITFNITGAGTGAKGAIVTLIGHL